ncbi:aminoglycoside phosphotransferase family protein [Actinomadura sp. 7K507]|uniref:phosphotransferase family protein n=1 Tax=Actinomadura sp. 7K507 TaxID=2530365 RepID=UPI0010489AF3|nr:aminoglycoside phosphotransferase family protein [Actinomadura sp. 7K507]TDC88820.1 aminoglycoside phosphotransferase family protein [Actinomadura sp. 7K507]
MYEWARAYGDPAAGFYNDNIRAETRDGPVNVRIPIHGADMMDLRPWREDRVLTAIAPHVASAPRLLHTSIDPPFQVQEFIADDVLNDIAPPGAAIPPHVLDDVVRLLTRVPRLPGTPAAWPDDGDTTAFARLLSDLTQQVFDTHSQDYADLFAALAVPADPLEAVNDLWDGLTPRPFTCVHADLHRHNMIIANGETTFLDWELTLWGDPVYDLAAHIHKMAYLPEERAALIACWRAAMPPDHITGWRQDLDAYLAHERIKSAIVDSVRYSQLSRGNGSYPEPQLIEIPHRQTQRGPLRLAHPAPIDARTVGKALSLQ